MNLSLTDEQMELEAAVERYLGERYDHEAGWRDGGSDAAWAGLAELGLAGACLPERVGGLGGGPVETMLTMRAFGRHVVVEPYLATVVLGAGALLAAGGPDALLGDVAAGTRQLALAYAEPQGRFDPEDQATTARRRGDDWELSGAKAFVLNGGRADDIIVAARTSGARRDAEGISLFLVPAGAAGLSLRRFRSQDGLDAADLVLAQVRGTLLGEVGGGLPVLLGVLEAANVAVCAMALGTMEAGVAMTADYLRLRRQFGRHLAEFQALQHRMVELHMAVEETFSLVLAATAALEDGAPDERARAVAAAKIHTAGAALLVGQEVVQLHGGIGMTAEHRIGRLYKRMLSCATLFGDAAFHTGRYALETGEAA